MTKDLTIMLKSQPGTLSQISALLGEMGINIEGIAGMQAPDKDVIHILVNEAEKAQKLLEKEGINATLRDVMIVDIEDRPGALGEIAQKLAQAGINITLVYLTTQSKLALCVDRYEKARDCLSID
jgi:hypothetical protein